MAKRDNHFTLPEAEYTGLLEAERRLTAILPDIDAAETCGIDCQDYRRQHSEAMEQISLIKMKFGPQSAITGG